MKIAVINDDPSVAELLGQLLEDRGWDIVTCCNGSSAYDVLQRERYDMVLLDLLSKKPQGSWDILTFLQLNRRLAGIPIIVVSGATDELLAMEEWLHRHGIGILLKPFDVDSLYGKVDAALRRSADATRIQ